jgi:hypothetical protein
MSGTGGSSSGFGSKMEMAQEMPVTPRDVGERAAGVLAPESELFEDLDAAGFGEALAKAMRAGATNPLIPGQAAIQLFADLARVPLATAAQWLGREVEPPVPVDPKDRRFADPAWSTNPWFYGVRLSYLAAAASPGRGGLGEPGAGRRAQGRDGHRADARRARADELPRDQPGRAQAGVRHRRDEPGQGCAQLRRRPAQQQGRPRQVDTSPFEVGRNLAATPAKVVYRNDLMELLQYEPQTEQVHAKPAAVQPAVDQQVLRHGPGARPQLHRVGGAARAHRVRDQLPEPVARRWRRHAGRLPRQRAADRAGRHPGDHRRRDDRHRRAVPRRRAHRDHRRLPEAVRRRAGSAR